MSKDRCQPVVLAYVDKIKFLEERLETTRQDLINARTELLKSSSNDFPEPKLNEFEVDLGRKRYDLEDPKVVLKLDDKLKPEEENTKSKTKFDLCKVAQHLCIETWVWDGVSYGKTLPEHFQKNA